MTEEDFKELLNNINDKVFKTCFQYQPTAVEYLQVFVSSIAALLDLEHLAIKDTNFVNAELEEYFCDVVYETKLKPLPNTKGSKHEVRVILLFEHKKGIKSYFDLFLQLLIYICSVWTQDRNAKRSPTIVIPLVINQSIKKLTERTLHDSFKHVPNELLKFIPQLQYHLLNIQPLDKDTLLSLQEDGLLRSLFMAYIAVEDKNRVDNMLIEIFKFMQSSPHLKQIFQQLFVFLAQEGYFSTSEIKDMLKEYLSSKEEKIMMTTAQVWAKEGEERGEKRGKEIGRVLTARLTVLRGCIKGYQAEVLSDLSGLDLESVMNLINEFNVVKKAWLNSNAHIANLTKVTTLSEDEIKYILERLTNQA